MTGDDSGPCPGCGTLVSLAWGVYAYCCDCSINDDHLASQVSCEVCGWVRP